MNIDKITSTQRTFLITEIRNAQGDLQAFDPENKEDLKKLDSLVDALVGHEVLTEDQKAMIYAIIDSSLDAEKEKGNTHAVHIIQTMIALT